MKKLAGMSIIALLTVALISLAAIGSNSGALSDKNTLNEVIHKQPTYSMTELDFLPVGENHDLFAYSGMWWMNREGFLKINPSNGFQNLESASFHAFRETGYDRVLLARDWLDFSVEHLSELYRCLDQSPLETSRRSLDILRNYSRKTMAQYEHMNETATFSTIAIIPVYEDPEELNDYRLDLLYDESPPIEDHEFHFIVCSMAVTIISLWRIGISRIVMVGNTERMPKIVVGARMLAASAISRGTTDFTATYVKADNIVKNTIGEVIMPGHAITNLQAAMSGNMSASHIHSWLGDDPGRWKYVYFSEPDLILHTREMTLSHITRKLDDGYLLAAHRFQWVPHQVDFPDHPYPSELVPDLGYLGTFHDLDSRTDACCWTGFSTPARDNFPNCGRPWYTCGLEWHGLSPVENALERLKRYKDYPLVRLKHGLGVPLVHEHAGLCRPSKRGACNNMI